MGWQLRAGEWQSWPLDGYALDIRLGVKPICGDVTRWVAMAQCEAGSKPVCGDVSHWVAMPQCKAAVVSQSVAMRATTSLRRVGATLTFRLGLPMEQGVITRRAVLTGSWSHWPWRARSRHVPRDLGLGRLHCELVGCLPSPVQRSPGLRWCLGVTATQ